MVCNGKTDACLSETDIKSHGALPNLEDVVRAILAIHGLGGMACVECYEKRGTHDRTAKWVLVAREKRSSGLHRVVCDECRGNRPVVEQDPRAPYLRVLERFLGRRS